MNVKDEARAAQAAFLEASGDAELTKLTFDLYDSVDNLDDNQRSLLVSVFLSKVHDFLLSAEGAMAGYATSLVAIAGYANQINYEAAGNTATGDRAVDAVTEKVQATLRQAALSGLSDEDKARAQAIGEEIRARVEAGEDPVAVHEDVKARVMAMRDHPSNGPGADASTLGAATASADDSDDRPIGMYL